MARTDSDNPRTFFYIGFYHTFGRFKPIYEQVPQSFYLAATMLIETIENTSLFSPLEIVLFYSLASSKYLCGGAKYFWFTQSISRQHTYNAKHAWDQIFQFQEIHLRNFRCMFLKVVYENSVTSSSATFWHVWIVVMALCASKHHFR